MNWRSRFGWVDEDVKALDAFALQTNHVRSGHRNGAFRWSRPPSQAGKPMVAYGRTNGRKDEVGWQTGQQRLDRMCDGIVASRYGIGLRTTSP